MDDMTEGKQYRYRAGWGEVGVDHYSRGDGSGDAMGDNVHGMGWGDGFGDGRAEYGTGFGQCLGASNDLGDGNG